MRAEVRAKDARAGGDHRAFQAGHRGDRRGPAAGLGQAAAGLGRAHRTAGQDLLLHACAHDDRARASLRLRLLAGLRWWRPRTYRFVEEQAEIDRWLEQIRSAGRINVDLAREIAECARLIKGYGDTYKRGLANYRRITTEVIEPALAWRMTPRAAADAVANARVAALADPEGETLSKTLAAIAAAAPVLRHAAE